MAMLIYVMAPTVLEYHDYLRREGIHEDAARFVVSPAVLSQAGKELVVVGYPDWYQQVA